MIVVPSAYSSSYPAARQINQSLADRYVSHTAVGDPELDSIMAELSSVPIKKLHQYIEAGIEQRGEQLLDAPQELREFFDRLESPPPWVDYEEFVPGIRSFHANVDLMLVAFVTGVLVEGFATMIAKSFNLTGRVKTTTRRLKQNNRHLMEIFYPGGLKRDGDGWKLSVRIRFIHSRIRNLLANSTEWNTEAWGTPVSAAHLGFAISVFSQRLLEFSTKVGARYSPEEKQSIMAIWRYAGYLMGIPESILYTDSSEAKQMYRIGRLCEPEPDEDCVTMSNVLIKSIPRFADISDPVEHDNLIELAYRLSRALIGNKLADQFQFPNSSTILTLFFYRWKQYVQRMKLGKLATRSNNFTQILQISAYDDHGISYKMPDHVHAVQSIDW